ncbi:MAG TPA: ComF family protein [Trueperaceae bacterium]
MLPRLPDRLAAAGLLLCPVCRSDWSGRDGCCAGCLERLRELAASGLELPGLAALGYYRGFLARAVRAYKYGQARRLVRPLATALATLVTRRGWRPRLLTHVPLHPNRRRRRGFDQAALLAGTLAELLGVPWRPLLDRVRATPQQARLSAVSRRRNVSGVFRPLAPARGTVLLVDDVFTTGATLGECREVLEAAGASAVLLGTLAVAGQNPRSAEPPDGQKETMTPLVIPSNAPTRTWG